MTSVQFDLVPVRRALISVYDKTGVEELAAGLHQAGVVIVSTGSTAARIQAAGIPVTGVEEVEGFDETWVQIHTVLGELTVRGEGLRVELLSVETGELRVEGEIGEMDYTEAPERRGLLRRFLG